MISLNNLWQLKSSQRIDVECTTRNNEKFTIIPQKTSKPKKKKKKKQFKKVIAKNILGFRWLLNLNSLTH